MAVLGSCVFVYVPHSIVIIYSRGKFGFCSLYLLISSPFQINHAITLSKLSPLRVQKKCHSYLPGQEHLHETPSTAAWACTEELLLAFEWTIWKINAIRWTLDNWIPKYLPIVFFVLLFLFSVNRGTIERATDQLLISLCRQRRNSPTVPLSSTVHRE